MGNEHTRWKPKQSGNPGGRPNFTKVLAELGMSTHQARVACTRFAFETMRNTKARTIDRLRAMEWIGGLVGLKPNLFGPGAGDENTQRSIVDMTDAELDAMIAEGEEIEGLIASGKVLDVGSDGTLSETPDGELDDPDDDDSLS